MPPQTDPRAPPCERSCNRREPAHGTEYGPPWVEMERPSQPNVAQVDGSRMRTRVRQLHRKENAVHEVAPSCAPASRATCACRSALDTQRRREATAATMPRQQGRVASHALTTGWAPAPPPSPAWTARDRPSTGVPPDPHVTECGPLRLFWWWCQPGPTRYRYNA